ncbi:MAG: helix-turn-helix domain-containing protein [bacterium]
MSYTVFPSQDCVVGFFKNTDIRITANEIELNTNKKETHKVIQLGRFKSPLRICYKNYVFKVSVHFMRESVNYFFPDYYFKFNVRNNIKTNNLERLNFSNELFQATCPFEVIKNLEECLISRYTHNPLTTLKSSVLLMEEKLNISLGLLSEKTFRTKKTLYRRYKNYLGCSPTEYKNILRFNRVIDDFLNHPDKSISEICYDNLYYDPSYFNKQIKVYTGLNPKDFFQKLKKSATLSNKYFID